MKSLRLLFVLFFVVAGAASAQEKIDLARLPAQDFLNIVRHAPSQETWAKMSGKVEHRRTGAATLTASIRLGVRFMPTRAVAQLVLDGEEIYNLGQTFAEPPRSTRMLEGRALDPEKAKLGIFGLSADDLLMGFLYKDLVREEAPQRVSIFDTRVLLMNADAPGEFARVYISTKYAFPIKVEWFKADPAKTPDAKPYRSIEIVSIKEKGDFVMASKLHLDGPGWRSRVSFDELDAGYAAQAVPQDLFLERK